MTREATQQLWFRLPRSAVPALRRIATEHDMTMTAVVRELVVRYLEAHTDYEAPKRMPLP